MATARIFSNSRRHCSKFRLGMWKNDKSSFNFTWGWRSWKQCWIFTRISVFNCDTIEPPVHESLDVPENHYKNFFDVIEIIKFSLILDIQSNLAIRNGFIRNKLVLRNHFLWPICHLLHKDKELLALRNNFRATKKFLIAKFDCTCF